MSLIFPAKFFNGGDTMSPERKRPALDPDPVSSPFGPIEGTAPRKPPILIQPPPDVPAPPQEKRKIEGGEPPIIFIDPDFKPEPHFGPPPPKEAPTLPEPSPDEKTFDEAEPKFAKGGEVTDGAVPSGAVEIKAPAEGAKGLDVMTFVIAAAVIVGVVVLVSTRPKK